VTFTWNRTPPWLLPGVGRFVTTPVPQDVTVVVDGGPAGASGTMLTTTLPSQYRDHRTETTSLPHPISSGEVRVPDALAKLPFHVVGTHAAGTGVGVGRCAGGVVAVGC
jgi:hypothetical protein